MKKTINKKVLESMVKKIITEALSKDSDELDRDNDMDRERINQEMDSDWGELETINKRYAKSAVKANPRFAKDFNHNVEDGREEAMTYSSGLYETIKRMVNEISNDKILNTYKAYQDNDDKDGNARMHWQNTKNRMQKSADNKGLKRNYSYDDEHAVDGCIDKQSDNILRGLKQRGCNWEKEDGIPQHKKNNADSINKNQRAYRTW